MFFMFNKFKKKENKENKEKQQTQNFNNEKNNEQPIPMEIEKCEEILLQSGEIKEKSDSSLSALAPTSPEDMTFIKISRA